MGPRAVLDRCGKSRPHQDSIPGPSNPQRVAIPSTLFRPIRVYTIYIYIYIYIYINDSTKVTRQRSVLLQLTVTRAVDNQLLLHNGFTTTYVLRILFLFIPSIAAKFVKPQHSN